MVRRRLARIGKSYLQILTLVDMYLIAHCHPLQLITVSLMENLWLYAILVFGIIVLPGMDMAFVLASSLTRGRAAGLAATFGMVAGGLAHTVMSALGIGVLVKNFPSVFNALLIAGCLYVAWMGFAIVRHAKAIASFGELPDVRQSSHWQTFTRAVLTCLMNPKAYLFMLAVFPQFLDASAGARWPLWLQAFVLFLIGAASQTVVYGSVALAAARARDWLRGNSKSQARFAMAVGVMLLLTAIWTLWNGWK
jgi:threonine/homoserine/homoserine lactone efflux protein